MRQTKKIWNPYHRIMENIIILGKLGKDFENITKDTGKKTTTRATLRELKMAWNQKYQWIDYF